MKYFAVTTKLELIELLSDGPKMYFYYMAEITHIWGGKGGKV